MRSVLTGSAAALLLGALLWILIGSGPGADRSESSDGTDSGRDAPTPARIAGEGSSPGTRTEHPRYRLPRREPGAPGSEERTVVVRGRLVDERGNAIDGRTLRLGDVAWVDAHDETTSSAGGHFELAWPQSFDARLVFLAQDVEEPIRVLHRSEAAGLDAWPLGDVPIPSDQRFSMRLIDAGGRPVTNAEIRALDRRGVSHPHVPVDAEGRFTWTTADPRRPLVVAHEARRSIFDAPVLQRGVARLPALEEQELPLPMDGEPMLPPLLRTYDPLRDGVAVSTAARWSGDRVRVSVRPDSRRFELTWESGISVFNSQSQEFDQPLGEYVREGGFRLEPPRFYPFEVRGLAEGEEAHFSLLEHRRPPDAMVRDFQLTGPWPPQSATILQQQRESQTELGPVQPMATFVTLAVHPWRELELQLPPWPPIGVWTIDLQPIVETELSLRYAGGAPVRAVRVRARCPELALDRAGLRCPAGVEREWLRTTAEDGSLRFGLCDHGVELTLADHPAFEPFRFEPGQLPARATWTLPDRDPR